MSKLCEKQQTLDSPRPMETISQLQDEVERLKEELAQKQRIIDQYRTERMEESESD